MMNILKNISPILLLFVLAGCGEFEMDDINHISFESPMFVRGDLLMPPNNQAESFEIDFGRAENDTEYTICDVSFLQRNPDRVSVFIEAFRFVDDENYPEHGDTEDNPIFGLEIFTTIPPPPPPPPNSWSYWDKEIVEVYFEVGTVFSVGEEINEVDVSIRLPEVFNFDYPPSKSSYLDSPQGELRIIEMEDYTGESFRWREPFVTGKLITAELTSRVGRYDYDADQADGMVGFRTDEYVELQNVTLKLFFQTGP